MRTPILILSIMLIAGTVMYFISRYQAPPGEYDTISIENKDADIYSKVKVFAVTEPTEIYFADSNWMKPDSTPLKVVADGSKVNFMNKQYASVALILTYDNSYFYDLEIDKPDPNEAFEISFAMKPEGDSVVVTGSVDKKEGDMVAFSGPMIKMYKQFILTYNNRMPPAPADSTAGDSTVLARAPMPNKTITVLEN